MSGSFKDLAAGLLFVAIGAFFAVNSLINHKTGTLLHMGPGFFPLALGVLLAVLGAAIVLAGRARPAEPLGHIPWRGLAMVLGAILFFAFTARGLGFAPALAGTVALSARASGKMSWTATAVLTVVTTFFSVLVFVKALGLPYRVFGPWLGF